MCFNFASRSSKLLSGPMQDPDMQIHGSMDQLPKEVERQRCPRLSISELNLANSTMEPKTGIEFPVVLDSLSAGEQSSRSDAEVNTCFTILLCWLF